MNTLFALVISVCALTGECSDVLIVFIHQRSVATATPMNKKYRASASPTEMHKTWLTTNSLQ